MKKHVSIALSLLILLSAAACSSKETYDNTSDTASYSISSVISDTASNTDTDTNIKNDIEEEILNDTNFNTDTNTNIEDTQIAAEDTSGTPQAGSAAVNKKSSDDNSLSDNTLSGTNISTCKIFRKVVCCGDSYTAGFIADAKGNPNRINEDYAWPHYMSTLTGNDWLNCGCSGCTVLTWQQHSRGLPAAKKFGKTQAYVIGLMINDIAVKNHVELGSIKDIDTNKETYYGGMSKIITELNKISPDAKIFVNTCPKSDGNYKKYNQAVRDIVNVYKDKYPVHCIDLEAHSDMYEVDSLKNDYWYSHYTAVGYEQFAEIYAVILSNYINEHIEDFRDVAFIEYDK